jgi:hypothetical protein
MRQCKRYSRLKMSGANIIKSVRKRCSFEEKYRIYQIVISVALNYQIDDFDIKKLQFCYFEN